MLHTEPSIEWLALLEARSKGKLKLVQGRQTMSYKGRCKRGLPEEVLPVKWAETQRRILPVSWPIHIPPDELMASLDHALPKCQPQ